MALGRGRAVIPTELTPSLAARLHRHGRNGTVRLHQHGYAHLNHEPTGRKCEFGASRSRSEVVAAIRNGAALLRDHLGEVDPVFTPPWNRSTAALADVLVAAGLTVLSRDHTAPTIGHAGLREVPVTVDWFGHDKGVRWAPERLAGRVAESVARDRVVGLMLHHAITDGAELTRVGELLRLLTGHAATTMTTLTALGTMAPRRTPCTDDGLPFLGKSWLDPPPDPDLPGAAVLLHPERVLGVLQPTFGATPQHDARIRSQEASPMNQSGAFMRPSTFGQA